MAQEVRAREIQDGNRELTANVYETVGRDE
jgi:hypothetical protein